MTYFQDKIALVTGAGSGIGKATALEFAKRGAKVVVADILETGEATRDEIKNQGGEAIFVQCDVSKFKDQEKLITTTLEKYHQLNFAHNNAGVDQMPVPFADLTEETWDRVININLKGVWIGMKLQIPHILKVGGAIVNTSSTISIRPFHLGIYGCAKAGINILTKAAAQDYAAQNLRINAVCPGPILTPIIEKVIEKKPEMMDVFKQSVPMGRLGTSEEVAKIVLWLCSEEASFVTGTCLVADGGLLI